MGVNRRAAPQMGRGEKAHSGTICFTCIRAWCSSNAGQRTEELRILQQGERAEIVFKVQECVLLFPGLSAQTLEKS